MKKKTHYFLLLLLLCLQAPFLKAQGDFPNENFIYADYIRSVQFHIEGLYLSYPIIELGGAARVTLAFDDLDGDTKDYFYKVVHCDRDWKPSQLAELEYVEGYTEERIQNFQFSFKSLWPYTHYELTLPNQDTRFTKSGNYLLLVYDDTYDRQLVLARRFVVVDPRVSIDPRVLRASQVSKFRTHQEIDFVVNHEQFKIQNPMAEIRATVLQNGRWDNALTDIAPKFIRANALLFDHQDVVVFPGGKEFRFLDLRSLRLVSFNVYSVERTDESIIVQLKYDEPRSGQAHTSFKDLNGNFVIETTDQPDNNLSAEYVEAVFYLKKPEPYFGKEVYLFGGLTDWTALPEYRMEYNEQLGAYVGQALLKQGYYDYAYATLPLPANNKDKVGQNRQPDITEVEGTWHETENQYTILIYYRPFGSRYDQVIGSLSFTSDL
ncbi:MAG: DUF5103 domain-containing protein [Phaeodactylibacter sp.]|nr:DUF5103 domain-containing protein [Phaeodactylibacter sp.]MCB9052006.1 DUF5103 domain-containing protein [Lewinellaceae bacterium]